MPESRNDAACAAWVRARVTEAGTIDAAKPDDFTVQAWRKLCKHYGVSSVRLGRASTLEEALKKVAELAQS